MSIDNAVSSSGWITGLSRAMPMAFGYLPVGIAFGILALETGLSPLMAVLMSVMVLGAASQLVAVQLIALSADPVVIVATTFIVNLRHMLMSSAMSPHLRGWRWYEIAFFSYGLTDEAFALHAARFESGPLDKGEAIAVNATAHGSWVFGTVLGVIAGPVLVGIEVLALDYALSAMFIALLAMMVRTRLQFLVGLAAGLTACAAALAGLDYWNIVVATVLCATLGLGAEKWISRRSS
ncbi:AzlC family ABC transporter permease [Arenibaculum sp.]|uniref:AzlC family ABC transporter permease n=1 Tax=Arenibaculum sp. TaxID=2865862 RepID=UPI002E1495A0|nr:AzlC family ABC transporter permease [Arenibaculum sp.]